MAKKEKVVKKVVLFIFVFVQAFYLYFFQTPTTTDSGNLTTVYDTISNPRLSYVAGVANAIGTGETIITIDTSGNPDNDTHNLFPKDNVCFADQGLNGCKGNTSYTVASIISSTNDNIFAISTGLVSALEATDYVIATQSAVHTVQFTTVSDVNGGKIKVKIPAATTNYGDSFPDQSGFDSNKLDDYQTANGNINPYVTVSCTGGCGATIGSKTLSYASGQHIITVNFTGTLPANKAVTVTIGSSSDINYQFVNPAPAVGHIQGTADTYTITVEETDASDNVIDATDTKIAVVEGVLVSATVEETIQFFIRAGTADTGTVCGVARNASSIDTTPYSVPFGSIISTNQFYDAYQELEVRTNATAGYTVVVEENDQMGKDGKVCTGATAGEANECIPDTTGDNGTASETTSDEWNTATNNGLGYSLENITGTDANFTYNESARTFSAKQFPDQEAGESKQTIMSNTGPVSSSKVNICYRLSVSNTQPAGYYFNKIKFTATAKF